MNKLAGWLLDVYAAESAGVVLWLVDEAILQA